MPRPRKPRDRFERYFDTTFGEAAARYLAEFDGKPGSKDRAAQALYSVAPYIGHLRLIDVDDEAMAQFKEDRRLGRSPFKKPAMAGTINKELTQVSTVLLRACRLWRWLESAPLIQHVKGPVRQAYRFNWEEQAKLFAHLPTGWDVGAAVFAVNTGVRREELFGLKWKDMVRLPELGDDVFVFLLAGDSTKNGESRAVICNSIARRAVNVQREWQLKHGQSEYVFPTRYLGRAGSRVRSAGVIWNRAWKKAGLPTGPLVKMGMHNCRHTFAFRLRAAGVPQEDRNALLGHAKSNLAEHYGPADLGRLLAYAELVTERKPMTVLKVAV